MRVKPGIVPVIMAAVFALGVSTDLLARDTVEVTIAPGTTLTASLTSDSVMEVARFSNTRQRSTCILTLRVEDGRGTHLGWRITIDAADFQPAGNPAAAPIPAGGFRLVSPGTLQAKIGATSGIGYGEPGTPLHTAETVMLAIPGAGTGIYRQDLNVELDIPAQTPAGIYRTQITVGITSAPVS